MITMQISSGSERPAAAVEALRRLGQQDGIAAAVLAKPELRSWSHRWLRLAGLMSHALLLLLLPVVPVVACAQRGPAIVRWSVSISLGTAITGGFLLAMAQPIFATL